MADESDQSRSRSLIKLAALDDELRADLRTLAQAILATEPAQSKTNTAPPGVASRGGADFDCRGWRAREPERGEAAQADSQQAAEPLRELTLGRALPSKNNHQSVASAMPRSKPAHDDLIEVEARCRRKGEAARWAAENASAWISRGGTASRSKPRR